MKGMKQGCIWEDKCEQLEDLKLRAETAEAEFKKATRKLEKLINFWQRQHTKEQERAEIAEKALELIGKRLNKDFPKWYLQQAKEEVERERK
jgi:hypothetical protein